LNYWFWLSIDHSLLLLDNSWLSHTVANGFDLWTHILVLKDLLILDNHIHAINEDELDKTVEHNTEALINDLFSFEALGLSESFLLDHIRKSVKPFLVRVMLWLLFLLWFIFFGIFLILWLLSVMSMVSSVVVTRMMMSPKSSCIDIGSEWCSFNWNLMPWHLLFK